MEDHDVGVLAVSEKLWKRFGQCGRGMVSGPQNVPTDVICTGSGQQVVEVIVIGSLTMIADVNNSDFLKGSGLSSMAESSEAEMYGIVVAIFVSKKRTPGRMLTNGGG